MRNGGATAFHGTIFQMEYGVEVGVGPGVTTTWAIGDEVTGIIPVVQYAVVTPSSSLILRKAVLYPSQPPSIIFGYVAIGHGGILWHAFSTSASSGQFVVIGIAGGLINMQFLTNILKWECGGCGQ